MTNLEAARTGDRRKALEELRDTLAGWLDSPDLDAKDRAPLAGQYRQALADLAAMPKADGGASTVDQLRQRREERQRAAKATAGRPAGRRTGTKSK